MWQALFSVAVLLNRPERGSSMDMEELKLRIGTNRCRDVKDIMEESTKQTILKEFNRERQEVAKDPEGPIKFPVAFPMSDLVWDVELEKHAKTFAMTCPIVALVNFNFTEIGSEMIGQSIVTKIWDANPQTDFPVEILIKRYSSAVKRMNSDQTTGLVKKYESGDWDSGFQILWENTTKVGCSYVTFKEPTIEGNKELSLNVLVCNFRPAGCIPDERVFRIKVEPKPMNEIEFVKQVAILDLLRVQQSDVRYDGGTGFVDDDVDVVVGHSLCGFVQGVPHRRLSVENLRMT
ncbi:hypothetical protein GE061_018565 [Apolygus lucorum]|uniref:SCP domain-containing protein n=1 Tax=Apolygus lucorum TaxID=248454 RepID=A0A8S9XFL1_APOLU|nr:hypothetical protein GE061_018565 [Apolygus lucorum]